MKKRLTTEGAAEAVGIARHTLQRWISEGRIKAPKPILRNGRAVRLWSKTDVKRLGNIKAGTYRKGRGRKPKPKR
jgi:excisionase family DNA binding protein